MKKFEKLRYLLNSIPRYLILLLNERGRPLRVKVESLNLLLPNTMNLHFEILNSRAHFLCIHYKCLIGFAYLPYLDLVSRYHHKRQVYSYEDVNKYRSNT